MRRDGEGARRFAEQRSELARGDSELARTELAPRSKTRAKFMREDRVPYIEQLAEVGIGCEIGMVLDEYGIPNACTGQLQGLHERRKRSAGGSLTNRANLIPACNPCNGLIEDQAGPVREAELARGANILVVREGDPEWESLGKRAD